MTPDDHTRTLLALDMATEWQHPEASPRRQRGATCTCRRSRLRRGRMRTWEATMARSDLSPTMERALLALSGWVDGDKQRIRWRTREALLRRGLVHNRVQLRLTGAGRIVADLIHARDHARDALAMEAEALAEFRALAATVIGTHDRHLYQGLCPDGVEGFDARDPECPTCRALVALREAL